VPLLVEALTLPLEERSELRLRRRHPVIASLLLFVFWTGQLGLAMHAPETAHRVCEHGELVDAPTVAPGFSLPASASTQAQLASSDGRSTGAGEHEHCAFSTLMQQTGLSATSALQVAVDAPRPLELAPATPSDAPGNVFSVYRLAPKTSPPA
jgi:hypothetical protein